MAATFGSGQFGSGTFADLTVYVSPGDLAVDLATDAPDISTATSVEPDPTAVDVTIDEPAATSIVGDQAIPGAIIVPVAADDPDITVAYTTDVDTTVVPVAADDPDTTFTPAPPTFGTGRFGWGTFGTFEVGDYEANCAPDDSLTTPVALGDDLTAWPNAGPDSITVSVAVDAPELSGPAAALPADGPAVPVAVGPPATTAQYTAAPDSVTIPIAVGIPDFPYRVDPTTTVASLTINVTVDPPTAAVNGMDAGMPAPAQPATGRFTLPFTFPMAFTRTQPVPSPPIISIDNPDGVGAVTNAPSGLTDDFTFPWRFPLPYEVGIDTHVGADEVAPDGIGVVDSTQISATGTAFPIAFPLCQGAVPPTPPVEGGRSNDTATPGEPWLGFPSRFPWPSGAIIAPPAPPIEQAPPEPDAPVEIPDDDEPVDPFGRPPIVDPVMVRQPVAPLVPALHWLGIGPWSSSVNWHGAPNYGVRANRYRIAGPLVPLPPATSKSFTLRLDGAGEATASFDLPRHQAFVVDELTTDLWWRRRDPYTGIVDNIGRFNADKVDVSQDADGIKVSASFVDYRGLMGERLILDYAHYQDVTQQTKANGKTITTHDTLVDSNWPKNTKVSEVLLFIYSQVQNMPVEWGDDFLAALSDDVLNPSTEDTLCGVLKTPFELPLGTTVEDAFKNLSIASTTPFEWYVELPHDRAVAAKLFIDFTLRGADKGIVLFDVASGSGAIASWTRQGAADKYANNLFFSGADGGVVVDIGGEIDQYQQRDASDADSKLKASATKIENDQLIEIAARKKLNELSDRRGTWTIVLKQGFWQGRGHIDLGDWITVRVRLGEDILTGKYRVTELNCTIDATSVETVTLTLGKPTPSSDPRSRHSPIAKLIRKLKAYQSMEGSA